MGFDDAPTDELEDEHGSGGRAPAGLADPPLFAPGRRLGGRYLLERKLGHGGMAVVWLATDERLDREVAIKVLSDTLTADHDYRGRFAREARVAAGLQHPNLVSVYDYDAGERPYLVMEYIEGGDLAARLEAGRPPAAEKLATGLLSALSHIHAAGVLHRDIKPQNVLVDGYGHARLSDFGIARPRDASSLTRTGMVIGTETYLAPEVRAGEPASERSDLYSLGVLLGDAAREGATAPLWKLTDELRQPDPERRPRSATAALEDFALAEVQPAGDATQAYGIEPPPPAVAEEPPAMRPFEPTPTGIHSPRRRSRALAIAAVAGVAVVALAFLLLGGGGGDQGQNADRSASAGSGSERGSGDESGGSDGSGGQGSSSDQPSAEPPPTGPAPSGGVPADDESTGDGSVASSDGLALNDEGFALVRDGRYEEAIPVLERAVEALGGSGDEATYNYALFNLASAYLGAGRAAEAIPLLEERMQFDDGQLGDVQAKLDEARAAAGVKPEKPEKSEKSGKGPKNGEVPPPFEEDGD